MHRYRQQQLRGRAVGPTDRIRQQLGEQALAGAGLQGPPEPHDPLPPIQGTEPRLEGVAGRDLELGIAGGDHVEPEERQRPLAVTRHEPPAHQGHELGAGMGRPRGPVLRV